MRLSVGHATTPEEIEQTLRVLREIARGGVDVDKERGLPCIHRIGKPVRRFFVENPKISSLPSQSRQLFAIISAIKIRKGALLEKRRGSLLGSSFSVAILAVAVYWFQSSSGTGGMRGGYYESETSRLGNIAYIL